MRLKDKVIIVTGGAMGIGRAYCVGLAKEGAKVVVADIQDAEAKKVAAEIQREGGTATNVAVDVTSPEKTRAMAETTLQHYGRIDVLVNNAGLYTTIKKRSFVELPPDEWDQIIAVNLKGQFLCAQAVYPAMQRQGKGKIINVSSGTIFSGSPHFVHYVTSKAGVIGFTRALARELGPRQHLRQRDYAGPHDLWSAAGGRDHPSAVGGSAQSKVFAERPVSSGPCRNRYFSLLRRQ